MPLKDLLVTEQHVTEEPWTEREVPREGGDGVPKVEVTLPSGGKATIEGTQEEVRELLEFYSVASSKNHSKNSKGIKLALSHRKRPAGPKGRVLGLKSEGFFGTKQSLRAVKERLEEKGHVYPQTTLSSSLIRLTKEGELIRVRDKGAWLYQAP